MRRLYFFQFIEWELWTEIITSNFGMLPISGWRLKNFKVSFGKQNKTKFCINVQSNSQQHFYSFTRLGPILESVNIKIFFFYRHNYSWQVTHSTFNIKFQKDFSHSFINESFMLELIIFNWLYRRWLFHIDNNFWDSEPQSTNCNLISLYICSAHGFKALALFQKLYILICKKRKINSHILSRVTHGWKW